MKMNGVLKKKAQILKAELLAASKAPKAVFWPPQGLKEGTFGSFGFTVEETSVSVSAEWLYPILAVRGGGGGYCY